MRVKSTPLTSRHVENNESTPGRPHSTAIDVNSKGNKEGAGAPLLPHNSTQGGYRRFLQGLLDVLLVAAVLTLIRVLLHIAITSEVLPDVQNVQGILKESRFWAVLFCLMSVCTLLTSVRIIRRSEGGFKDVLLVFLVLTVLSFTAFEHFAGVKNQEADNNRPKSKDTVISEESLNSTSVSTPCSRNVNPSFLLELFLWSLVVSLVGHYFIRVPCKGLSRSGKSLALAHLQRSCLGCVFIVATVVHFATNDGPSCTEILSCLSEGRYLLFGLYSVLMLLYSIPALRIRSGSMLRKACALHALESCFFFSTALLQMMYAFGVRCCDEVVLNQSSLRLRVFLTEALEESLRMELPPRSQSRLPPAIWCGIFVYTLAGVVCALMSRWALTNARDIDWAKSFEKRSGRKVAQDINRYDCESTSSWDYSTTKELESPQNGSEMIS